MKKILLAILAFAILSISLESCSVNSEANTQVQIIGNVAVQKITVDGTRCVLADSYHGVAISCNWFND